jgi:hypothetical protein
MEDNDNNYKRLFKEILQNSLKTNCLCYYLNLNKKDTRDSYRNNFKNSGIFDNYGAYLEDDESEEEVKIDEENIHLIRFNSNSSNRCDTSCYKKMQLIYNQLSNCFDSTNDVSEEKEYDLFLNIWKQCLLFKFPNAVDNFGSSIYHYATSKNNLKLLKCLISVNKEEAVKLCDLKGMTILTRACQQNSSSICEYLLTETNSNPNGSFECIYTPLLISITHGFYSQAKLLLEMGAYPNYIERDGTSGNANNQFALILSPIRSAIIYEKCQILRLLLKNGANVNEMIVNGSNLLNAKLSDYLNCLNILFRHLNQANFKYMIELNDFIENVNIYREMAIAFLRSIFINENDESIKEKFNQLILNDFDLNKTNLTFTQTLLLEYLIKLLNSFYKTKSLKELSRFNIRKHISICNNRNFNFVVKRIQGVPKSLKLYLLYENT